MCDCLRLQFIKHASIGVSFCCVCFSLLMVRDLSHWLCLCCAQQEKGRLSGETVEATSYTSNNRKEQGGRQEGEGRGGEGVAAGDPIKIFDKHCSMDKT